MSVITSPPGRSGAEPHDDSTARRRRLLGIGLRADLVSPADVARDVGLRRTAAGVDLDVVEGVESLCQDLAIGLTTLRGSDPCNVSFGFLGLGPLAEQTSPVLAAEALRSAVAQLVAADPRVRRIVGLVVSAPVRGSGGLGLTVSFEAISGDPARLAVGGMASGAPWGVLPPPDQAAPPEVIA